MSAIRVGTASVNWGYDPLYTWVQPAPFERMLDEMAAAGYAGTEISYNFPRDATHVRAELQRRHLDAASTFFAFDWRQRAKHDAGMQQVRETAALLQRLGADVLVFSDAPSAERLAIAGRVTRSDEQSLDDEAWRALADGLNRAGDALAAAGMRAVFHPHAGTYVETRAEIDKLFSLLDERRMGLCPDTGHLAYAGVDVDRLFADYARRIWYVHLKDVDAGMLARVRSEHIDFAGAVQLGLFVELGHGMVNVGAILDSLRQAQYRGWIIVEQDAPKEPFAAACRNRAYLRDRFRV